MKLFGCALVSVIFLTCAPVYAANMQVCVDKSGKLIATTKCGRGQTALTSKNLGSLGLRGPQGPAGNFNIANCVWRQASSVSNASSFGVNGG